MSHHNLEQISQATLIVSCAGVFISPELIKPAKMCRKVQIVTQKQTLTLLTHSFYGGKS
jgi:hypothetical protein